MSFRAAAPLLAAVLLVAAAAAACSASPTPATVTKGVDHKMPPGLVGKMSESEYQNLPPDVAAGALKMTDKELKYFVAVFSGTAPDTVSDADEQRILAEHADKLGSTPSAGTTTKHKGSFLEQMASTRAGAKYVVGVTKAQFANDLSVLRDDAANKILCHWTSAKGSYIETSSKYTFQGWTFTLDSKKRVTRASGKVSNGGGSPSTDHVRTYVRQFGSQLDEAGHIQAASLGGSDCPQNFFPQGAASNQHGQWSQAENWARLGALSCKNMYVSIDFKYNDAHAFPLRPIGGTYTVANAEHGCFFKGTNKYDFKNTNVPEDE